jgi:hypothetical protein
MLVRLLFWLLRSMFVVEEKENEKQNVKEQSSWCCQNGEKAGKKKSGKREKEARSGVRAEVDGNNINRELHRHGKSEREKSKPKHANALKGSLTLFPV